MALRRDITHLFAVFVAHGAIKINNTVSKYSSAVHAAFECFILIVTIMEFTNKQKRGYISYSTFDNRKANKYYSKINQTGIFRHITNK